MVQPINYLAMMPQVDIGQSIAQGLQLGSAIRGMREQAQMAEAMAARQAQLESARQKALMTNAPEDIKAWASLDPKAFSEYSTGIERMSKEQRAQEFDAAMPIYQALQNGEVPTAMKLLRRRADALRNSGQEDEADQLDLVHQYIGNSDPSKAMNTMQWLINGIDPDRFKTMQENLAKAQPNIEKANQNYVKMFGRHAYSLIQQGKPADAIAMLDTRIKEGKQKGYNTEPLEVMKMEAESRFDGSPDSIGLVLSGIDEKLGEDLKNIGEIALKKAQTEETTARNAINKDFAAKQAQADLDAKLAQAAQTQAETAATEQKRLLDAEMQPRIQAAELAKTQAETAAKQQATLIEAQYTPVLKELEIKAAQAKAAADARQAEIDAKYKEPMAALQLQAQQAAVAKAQRDNEIEAKYADQVAQAKMTTEQANARIAEEKAANAQVFEQSQARLADANAQIAAEKAEVARPAEQAALELSQANARMSQEKAAVAQTVEQANAEITRLNAEKAARENAIGQDLDRAKAEATTREAEAKAKSAEAAAKYAAQTEEINFKEKERAHQQAKKEQTLKLEKQAADLALTRAETTRALVTGKKLGAETQQILLEIEAMKKSPGGLKPQDMFTAEKDLRNEYLKRTDKYREMKRQFEGMQSASKDISGPGDVALIMGFQKMLDPTSVVRETEFAIAEQSAGRMEQLLNTLTKFKTGQRLTPEQRTSFMNLARKYYDAAAKQENEDRNVMKKVINTYGLKEENIMPKNSVISAPVPSGSVKQPTGIPAGFTIKQVIKP